MFRRGGDSLEKKQDRDCRDEAMNLKESKTMSKMVISKFKKTTYVSDGFSISK